MDGPTLVPLMVLEEMFYALRTPPHALLLTSPRTVPRMVLVAPELFPPMVMVLGAILMLLLRVLSALLARPTVQLVIGALVQKTLVPLEVMVAAILARSPEDRTLTVLPLLVPYRLPLPPILLLRAALARIVIPMLYRPEELIPPGPFPRIMNAELVPKQAMKLIVLTCLPAMAKEETLTLHPELMDGTTELNAEEMAPLPSLNIVVSVPDRLILKLIGAPLLLVRNLVGVQEALVLMASALLLVMELGSSVVTLLLPRTSSALKFRTEASDELPDELLSPDVALASLAAL